MSAQMEARIQKKPRRIIHNQLLIRVIIMLILGVPIPLGGVMFWLVFGVAPAVVIPSILVADVVGSVGYIGLRLYVERKDRVVK